MINICIVDDEPDFLEVVELIFSNNFSSVNILKANDGEEALKLVKENNISILITDLKMPQKEGNQLIYELSQLNKLPKNILVISGHIELEEPHKQETDLYFFTKPLKSESFIETIKNILETLSV